MIFKDYYKILGLESNKVSMNDIKVAYREQAKKYHPDVNISNKRNEERFKDINEAYRILSDATSKRKYDRQWHRNIGRMNSTYAKTKRDRDSISSDFINMFFGKIDENKKDIMEEKLSKKSKAESGENVETEISISIEDAFRGKEQSVGIRNSDGSIKKFKVQVPPGIQANERIRLSGQGKEGKNGGKNGDLYIRIKIKDDDRFTLIGNDLLTDLYLTPWEAALSSKVTVQGINEDVSVFVPPGIQSGEKIEIDNMGYIDKNGSRGKLILETKIMVPKNITEEEMLLFKKMNKISKFNPRKKENLN